MEIWIDVVNYKGYYQISSLGRLKSVPRKINRLGRGGNYHILYVKKKIKSSSLCKTTPYVYVTLCKDKKEKRIAIHSLVAEAFLGKMPTGCHVRHLDGNPKNNNISNLKYGTPKENCNDTIRHGNTLRGIKNPSAILSKNYVKIIRKMRDDGFSSGFLSKFFCVSLGCIKQIHKRRTWGWLA